MLPAPLGGQDAPPAPEQVQVTPVTVAGKLSVTVAVPETLGPAFEAVMV